MSIVPIELVSEIAVSPDDPGWFRVTAENRGHQRVVWGRGSSSCQLGLVVQLGFAFVRTNELRACTVDLAEQGLDPGATRSEVILWGGEVLTGSGPRVLEPGRYRIRGIAGGGAGRSR